MKMCVCQSLDKNSTLILILFSHQVHLIFLLLHCDGAVERLV